MSVASRIPKPSPKATPPRARGAAQPQCSPQPKPTPPSKLRSRAAALRSDLADVSDQLTAAQHKLSRLEQRRLEAETPPHLRCPITLQRMCSPVRSPSCSPSQARALPPSHPPMRRAIAPEIVQDSCLCVLQVIVADGHTFERRAIEQWLMQHDTNPLTGTALPGGALYPSLALRDATRAWEMEHGRSPTPRPSALPPPTPSSEDESEFEEEEEQEEGEEFGEQYGGEEDEDQDQGENEDTVTPEDLEAGVQRAQSLFERTTADLEAVQQSLASVAVEASEQPRDATTADTSEDEEEADGVEIILHDHSEGLTEDERLLNLGREIAQTRARFEARMAAITPAERELSRARYAALMAERQAASERYEQWQRQESRRAAGAQWLSELAEQRESELAGAAAEAEHEVAAPYRQSNTEEPSRLLPGVAITLHGLSGPRGEALNGRSSIW